MKAIATTGRNLSQESHTCESLCVSLRLKTSCRLLGNSRADIFVLYSDEHVAFLSDS